MKKNLALPARIARGFTLLEMLVVLTIIGLVAGIVGPRVFGTTNRARVQTAGAQIKTLQGAVEMLRLDLGAYPTQEQGLKLLNVAPEDPALKAKWRGPYLNEGVPQDPWGNAYVYQNPGPDSKPFVIISLGADGKPGGEKDDADIGGGTLEPAK